MDTIDNIQRRAADRLSHHIKSRPRSHEVRGQLLLNSLAVQKHSSQFVVVLLHMSASIVIVSAAHPTQSKQLVLCRVRSSSVAWSHTPQLDNRDASGARDKGSCCCCCCSCCSCSCIVPGTLGWASLAVCCIG